METASVGVSETDVDAKDVATTRRGLRCTHSELSQKRRRIFFYTGVGLVWSAIVFCTLSAMTSVSLADWPSSISGLVRTPTDGSYLTMHGQLYNGFALPGTLLILLSWRYDHDNSDFGLARHTVIGVSGMLVVLFPTNLGTQPTYRLIQGLHVVAVMGAVGFQPLSLLWIHRHRRAQSMESHFSFYLSILTLIVVGLFGTAHMAVQSGYQWEALPAPAWLRITSFFFECLAGLLVQINALYEIRQ